jgi:hypothetical protein
MHKDCKPRSVERYKPESSSSGTPPTREIDDASSTYNTSYNHSPSQVPELPRKVPSRPEIIISELMKQLPSLPESEAFDLGREVNRQLKSWMIKSKLSFLKFRRTHLCDTLSGAGVTILDYICHASESNDFSSMNGTVSFPQPPKQIQGVIVIAQRDSSGDQVPSLIHATAPFGNDSRNGPATQERFDLSFQLQLCSGHRSDELRMVLDAVFLEIYKGDWADDIPPINANCILPIAAKESTVDTGLSQKSAAVKRVCAWGAVAALIRGDDYRFFSTCALGIFANLSGIYPREPPEIAQDLCDFSIKAIPLLGLRDRIYGISRVVFTDL